MENLDQRFSPSFDSTRTPRRQTYCLAEGIEPRAPDETASDLQTDTPKS